MFHRECGYYKTSYESDQAILPFPIAKQAIIGFLLFFGVIMPVFGSEYYLAQLSLVGIAKLFASFVANRALNGYCRSVVHK